MNQSAIVAPYLTKAQSDVLEAMHYIAPQYENSTELAIEALSRAIASVAMAVERLAELVIDD